MTDTAPLAATSILGQIQTTDTEHPLHTHVSGLSPSLKMFKDTSKSLKDFFAPVTAWSPQNKDFPYLEAYKTLITNETSRLYGTKIAETLARQIDTTPICETGTHLSLLHDTDGNNTSYGFDNTLVLNRLVNSAAVYAANDMKIHLGCRSSHVNITNTNGARFIQLYPKAALMALHSNKNSDNLVRYAPKVSDDVLQQIQKQKYPVQFATSVNDIVQAMTGKTTFADQIAYTQSMQINQFLPSTITDVTIDDSSLLEKLMIASFKDPSSLYHQIFADQALQTQFVHQLADIRAGWRNTEDGMQSPFSTVESSGNKKKIRRAMMDDFAHTPQNLASLMEQGKIIPTCVMEFSFLLSQTGFLPHGGGFQHQYATEIQTAFTPFLHGIGAHDQANALASLPLDHAVLPQGAGIMQGDALVNFSSLLTNPVTSDELSKLADTPVQTLFAISAPDIYNFFHINENKSAGNEPLFMPEQYYADYTKPSLIIR